MDMLPLANMFVASALPLNWPDQLFAVVPEVKVAVAPSTVVKFALTFADGLLAEAIAMAVPLLAKTGLETFPRLPKESPAPAATQVGLV